MCKTDHSAFEILDGLPPYGPLAVQFTSSSQGTHREGYVVKFRPKGAEEWAGNFQPGITRFYKVFVHPNQQHLVIVAGGIAYVIDPVDRKFVADFGGCIEMAVEVPSFDAILFSNGLWFELLGPNGLKWKTRRLSRDGMRNVQVLATNIVGEGWRLDETWHPFSVELATGASMGGAYEGKESGETG